jgi:hypothetical protein
LVSGKIFSQKAVWRWDNSTNLSAFF